MVKEFGVNLSFAIEYDDRICYMREQEGWLAQSFFLAITGE